MTRAGAARAGGARYWPAVRSQGTPRAELLYERLFELDPAARDLVRSTDMHAQGPKVIATLCSVLWLRR